MSLVAEQWKFLQDVSRLIQRLPSYNLIATGGELWRSPEQQLIYFNTGKSKVRVGGNHGRRLAIDLNIFKDGRLATLEEILPAGSFWELLDPLNRWGGNFSTIKDGPHFERNVP